MNINKKDFCENENKTSMNYKKHINGLSSNFIETKFNYPTHKYKNSDFQINKRIENNLKKNKSYQNNLISNKINNNNLLTKIVKGEKNLKNKKDANDKDNVSLEVKVIFDRKANKIDNNLLKENKIKSIPQLKNEKNIINNNKIKFPQDNIKKQLHKYQPSNKTFNNKININENTNFLMDYPKKENEKDNKIKNDNLNTGKVVFNNKVKKGEIEKKPDNRSSKAAISNDTLENIFLLKSLIQQNDSTTEEYINNKKSYLYFLKDQKSSINKIEDYSNMDDYDNIIKENLSDKIILSQKLLQLKKRNWYYELKMISEYLSENVDKINKDNFFDIYFHKISKIYEHYNWIVNSISTYYNILFQNNKKLNPIFLKDINLPEMNSPLWKEGFEWKDLFIIALPENKSLAIKNEIKAMKYCFFDYLQILEKEDSNKDKKISNEIIFPLIGYSIVNGIVIYVSVLINPDRSFNNNNDFVELFINEIITHNKEIINYYSNNNHNNFEGEEIKTTLSKKNIYQLIGQIEKNYYIANLLESKLFLNMSEFHLIPYLGGKFILINAYKLVSNLFEINYKNYRQINIFSEINNTKLNDCFIYDLKMKVYLNNNNQQIYKNTKDIMEKYNLNIYKPIIIKDIIINKIHFRILYENIININKNYKTRRFIDNIINYENNYFEFENKNMKYIGENYLIIYDLIEPLKLEYSLMKKIKNEKAQKKSKFLFYLQTNYMSYILSWCKYLSKNSYNIKTYSELKYSMKKFGINSNLKFFSLMNIENEEIKDIIKISILTKLIKYIFNYQDNNIISNNNAKYLFEDERIRRILLIIKCILYINEISANEKIIFDNLYEGLVFYTNIFLFKMRLIDDYLSLGFFKDNNINEININLSKDIPSLKEELYLLDQDIKEFNTSKIFLKNIIYTARKKPFLFLSELELKLNFIINPFIKFKSSISIESMYKKLTLNHINLNNYFNIYSYINSDEISGFILAKLIKNHEDNKTKSKIDNQNSIKINEEKYNKIIDENENNFEFKLEEVESFETKSYNQAINKSNSNKNSIKSIKHYTSSRKSSLPKSPIKRNFKHLEKQNPVINWNSIDENLFFHLPFICYKMNFEYENSENKNSIFKDSYHISDTKIFFEYFSKLNSIYKNIYSCNGKLEKTLFNSLIPMYIITFFIEKNHEECKNIIQKIKELYSSGTYFLSFAELALINFFQGLSCEAYLDSEEPYTKSVLFFLMLFGDPRGRNNDSHQIMQLPLWKIVRKTMKLEKEQPENNQYLYEMYKSLEFFNSTKDKLNIKINNNINFDYEKNILKNIKMILKLNDFTSLENEEQNNNVNDYKNYINHEYYLSKNVFSEHYLNLYLIKNFKFPFVEEQTNKVIKKIYSKEFIIFLFKQLQSILIGKYKIYDEKYINDNISNNILNLNKTDAKKISLREINIRGNNKSSINIKSDIQKNEMEFSPSQLINAFKQGQKIFEIFSFNNKYNKDTNVNKNIKSPNKEIISKFKFGKNPNNSVQNNKPGKLGIFSHFLYDELLQKLSYKENCPSGIVLSFGNNSHFETTYEDYKIIKYPLLIYKLKNIIVKKIYSGWEHNIIISNTNEIYSFGNNNKFQCGVPFSDDYKKDNETIKNPKNISSINGGIKGISAACGNEHTLILDENRNVYAFGSNEDGVLGVENHDLKSYSFIKVDFGNYNGRIKDISAGTIHNIALTEDGKIFSWGSAQGGQLGLSENYLISQNFKNFSTSTPSLVEIKQDLNLDEPMRIIKIACGEAHTIVLNSKKEVYSWGFGSNGQLGLGFCEDSFELGTGLSKSRIFTPKKIQTLQNKKISDIQCGKTFSMFIDSNGGLYSCGVNDLHQLGIPDLPPQNHVKNYDVQCMDYIIPTRLEYFLDMKVEKISCGEAHCVAIVRDNHSKDKLIWSWGNNRYGQLGLGDKNKVSLPKPITFLFGYKNNKFESVSCGGFHSLCLIKHKEDINWIENDFKYNICKIINDIWNL